MGVALQWSWPQVHIVVPLRRRSEFGAGNSLCVKAGNNLAPLNINVLKKRRIQSNLEPTDFATKQMTANGRQYHVMIGGRKRPLKNWRISGVIWLVRSTS